MESQSLSFTTGAAANKPMTKAQIAKMERLMAKELKGRKCKVFMEGKDGKLVTIGGMDPVDLNIVAVGLLYRSCENNAFITKIMLKRILKAIKHLDKQGGIVDADWQ